MRPRHVAASRTLLCACILFALPALVRAEPVRLEAGWQLATDPGATFTVASLPADGWRSVKTGLSWNAQFADLRDYVGVAWYRVPFAVPASKQKQRVLLRFDAVDHHAEVFVNGEPVGLAKTHTFDRRPLEPIDPTVIPAGHLYVQGTSPDSFDSRYSLAGLVRVQDVKSRVIPLL